MAEADFLIDFHIRPSFSRLAIVRLERPAAEPTLNAVFIYRSGFGGHVVRKCGEIVINSLLSKENIKNRRFVHRGFSRKRGKLRT